MAENIKTAAVTGASRGIGRAIAERLAKEGYNLGLICSREIDKLNELAVRLTEEYGIECVAYQADVADFKQVSEFFALPFFEKNGLDLLVNNAGVSYVGLLHEMTPEEWHRVIATNMDSVFYASRQAIPFMLKKNSGRIINISSVWGNVGASMEVAYSTSKGGINTFTKALAKELAPSGIAVNAVACGLIDTSMNACFSEEDIAAVVAEIPADRIGKPEEVADVVFSLAESPDYVTGQILTVDGGWT